MATLSADEPAGDSPLSLHSSSGVLTSALTAPSSPLPETEEEGELNWRDGSKEATTCAESKDGVAHDDTVFGDDDDKVLGKPVLPTADSEGVDNDAAAPGSSGSSGGSAAEKVEGKRAVSGVELSPTAAPTAPEPAPADDDAGAPSSSQPDASVTEPRRDSDATRTRPRSATYDVPIKTALAAQAAGSVSRCDGIGSDDVAVAGEDSTAPARIERSSSLDGKRWNSDTATPSISAKAGDRGVAGTPAEASSGAGDVVFAPPPPMPRKKATTAAAEGEKASTATAPASEDLTKPATSARPIQRGAFLEAHLPWGRRRRMLGELRWKAAGAGVGRVSRCVCMRN